MAGLRLHADAAVGGVDHLVAEREAQPVARAVAEDAKEIKKDLSVIVDDSKPMEAGEED